MDEITRGAMEHKKISEFISFYKHALTQWSYGNAQHQFESFKKLVALVRAHFAFEEADVFPLLLSTGEDRDKAVINQLESEHGEISARLAEFETLSAEKPNEATSQRAVELAKGIVRAMEEHALLEDWKLYPRIENLDLNSK